MEISYHIDTIPSSTSAPRSAEEQARRGARRAALKHMLKYGSVTPSRSHRCQRAPRLRWRICVRRCQRRHAALAAFDAPATGEGHHLPEGAGMSTAGDDHSVETLVEDALEELQTLQPAERGQPTL